MSNITSTSKQYFKKLLSPLAIAVLVLSALLVLLIPHKALATDPDPNITGGGNVSVAKGSTVSITPAITVTSTSGTASVQLSVPSGVLSMTTTTGLTFTGPSSGSILRFTGSLSDVNNALATLQYRNDTATGTFTLTASIWDNTVLYDANTGKFYQYVSTSTDFATALSNSTAATYRSDSGHLLTITSQEESDFLTSQFNPYGESWIAAQDEATEGSWKWVAGPEYDTTFWSGGPRGGGGAPVGGNYSDWVYGFSPTNDSTANCAYANFYQAFYPYPAGSYWYNVDCASTINHYIIEFEAATLPTQQTMQITVTPSSGNNISVGSCEDLQNIADNPGSHVYDTITLTTSLNCPSLTTLFSDPDIPFKGSFEGGGNTIAGLNILGTDAVGLFGFTDSATIKDLTVAGTVQGDNCVGGIVGDATNTNLEGNTSSVNITALLDYGFGFGGIVGCYTSNGSDSFAVRTNSYSGTITKDGGVVYYTKVGGIVGLSLNYGEATVNIDNNQFSGTIDQCNFSCGGVVGYDEAYEQATVTANSNTNTGTIQDSSYYIGGIIGYGYAYDGPSLQANSNNFASSAKIINTGYYAGGVSGELDAYDATTIQTNYNQSNGLIDSDGNSAGMVGYYYCYSYLISGNGCELSYNTNNSGINGTESGGIIGYLDNYAHFSMQHNTNNGAVSGDSRIGGMIGYLDNYAHFSMQHNTNDGAVSGDSRIGGMIGYVDANQYQTGYNHSLDVQYNQVNNPAAASNGHPSWAQILAARPQLLANGWQANYNYTTAQGHSDVVQFLKPTGSNNVFIAEIINQDTGASEPTWASAPNPGDTVDDNGITWYNVGPYATFPQAPTTWAPNTNYALGAMVWPTVANNRLYVQYPPATTSGATEPDFNSTDPSSYVDDGSAYWMELGAVGVVSASSREAGGIIGRMDSYTSYGDGKGDITIDNNTVDADVEGATNSYQIGGVIGYLYHDSPQSSTDLDSNVSLSNNIVNGAVSGVYSVAGVAGYVSTVDQSGGHTKTILKVNNNAVNGAISATTTGYQIASGIGGLLGYTYLEYTDSSINDNEVTSAVTVTSTSGTPYSIAGAIGELDYDGGTNQAARNIFSGSVTVDAGSNSDSSIGGIIGYFYGIDGGQSLIKNNFNYGNVESKSAGSHDVAGIIGDTYTNNYDLTVTENLNEGDVVATNATNTDGYGGVIGYAQNTSSGTATPTIRISRNINRGNISSIQRNGGLIGDIENYSTDSSEQNIYIEDNYNTGQISTTLVSGDTGGLIAYINHYANTLATSSLEIQRNYASGNVSGGSSDTGGLVGDATTGANATTKLNSSFYTGTLSGSGNLAAIIGYMDGAVFENGNDLYYYNPSPLDCANNGTIDCKPEPATQFTTGPSLQDNLPINTWDFVNVWGYQPTINGGLPCLQWENPLCAPDADTDGDGISNSVEGAAPNGGDANDDNFPDYLQSNVTSLVSPVSSKYVVVQTTCTQNSSTSNSAESTTSPDTNYDYPSGLSSFTTTCPSEGYTAQITYFAYGSYDPTKTSLRKFNPTTGAYTTLLGADLSTTTIGGQSVLKGIYSITDGGAFDLDGTVNGVIVDPVGAAIAATIAPNTGYGWGE